MADLNYGDFVDKMTIFCDKMSDPTPIHVASRIDRQDYDPIEAGSFVESDLSWAGEKLLIRSRYQQWLDRFWNRAQSITGETLPVAQYTVDPFTNKDQCIKQCHIRCDQI